MKSFYVIITLAALAIALAGCSLKENYSVQYGFSKEISTETKFEVVGGVVKVEAPFADFSCNQKSFKATLSRQGQVFTMRLSGVETAERCSAKFFADIFGLAPGAYQFKLVYTHDGKTEQPVSREFTISP